MTTASKTDDTIDPVPLDSDLDRILAILYNENVVHKKVWISSLVISNILLETHGLSIHWRSIDKLLNLNKEYVDRRKRNKRWEYYLLSAGIEKIMSNESSITLINPAEAMQATISLHSLFSKLKGIVCICDPYLDDATLEHIESVPKNVELKLLTKTIRDSGKLRRLLSAAKSDFNKFELRKTTTAPLHDRYIIDVSDMIILGTSINGFPKKQCFIVRTGDDIRRATKKTFDSIWSTSSQWP
ncbi:hypothetical protein QLX67_13550 [Balneolaceae bacterium ANBcel3]|nr:hypothetical protein [Balneolaceae bacterium ANBcel3]